MIEITEFKGNKVLVLKRNPEDSYPFSFGLSKAKLIREHIDDINRFIDEYDIKKELPKEDNTKLKVDLSNELPEGEEETIE